MPSTDRFEAFLLSMHPWRRQPEDALQAMAETLKLPSGQVTKAKPKEGLWKDVDEKLTKESPEAALALAEEELAKAKQATMDGLNGDIAMARQRSRGIVLILTVAVYIALKAVLSGSERAAFSYLSSPRDDSASLTSRRDTLATAASVASVGLSLPSFAEEEQKEVKPPPRGWQMKLPEGWQIYRQFGVPGGDSSKGAEVKDPDGTGALTLIEYFQIPFPRVTRKSVVESLSKAFARQKATYAFELDGDGEDRVKDKQKYMLYEFDLTRCEGRQVYGSNGKICQRRGATCLKFHHLNIQTVTPEPTQTSREAFAEVLWIVDISAPAENWRNLSSQVATMVKTFTVGTVDQLSAGRNSTSTSS
eukprot:symbB.v1.2.021911.t1/scaffold1920.1/size100294/5